MFKELVVGVDEREGGRDAITLATILTEPGGKLTLAHVITSVPYVYRGVTASYVAAERAPALQQLERDRALALLESARGRAGAGRAGVETTLRCVEAASAGRGLHDLAALQHTDLIVLGSSRQSLLGRVVISDDTRRALNAAPCAVAIAPAGYAEHPDAVREIGVGYDGSPESEHALEVARGLAAEYDATVSAFEAVSVPIAGFGPGPLPVSDVIETLVGQARERIRGLGDIEPHAAYGPAAEELARYSASLDLLIVGSRGYGPIGRLIHGSTSQQLARTARCPLLVLPRAADAAEIRGGSKDERATVIATDA